jgi:arsenical pump membrane protein
MAVARLLLLAAGALGVLVRPRRIPVWAVPVVAATAGVATQVVEWHTASSALRTMLSPLAFLLLAVPMAVLLDRLGFFTAIAARIDHSHHLHLGLWLFAALVTTVFNLDASVVLLTPLYIRIARRHGLDPLPLAIAPALLACLASSALPVSNLTNLLAAERLHLGATDFLTRLGPASATAVAVGYLAYRRAFPEREPGDGIDEPVDPRAIRLGGPVVAFVLLGFTVGDHVGVPAWAIAAAADLALVAMVRRVPWRSIPAGAAALAGALGVLADAAAPHLGLDRLLDHHHTAAGLRTFAVSLVGANAVNNLPATLVALPTVAAHPDDRVWYLLLAVNLGPVLVVTGSLAGLLWLDTARRLDVRATARTYSSAGVRVGLPALAAALVVLWATIVLAG